MKHEDKSQAPIPDLTAETLMPIKGVGLSVFAKLVWLTASVILASIVWLGVTKFDLERVRGPDHFINKARQAIEAKDWPAALNAIQRVEQSARDQPQFLRVLANYLTGTRSEPALLADTLEQLRGGPLWTSEDGSVLAQVYLATNRVPSARKLLQSWTANERSSKAGMTVEIALLRAEGRLAEATRVEDRLFDAFANEPDILVRKAARDLTGTFPEIRQAAEEQLWKAASAQDEFGIFALRVLASYSGITLPQALKLKKLALIHPLTTTADHLQITSILIRLEPSERESLVKTEIQRFKASGESSPQALVAWLAREHEFAKIYEVVPRDSIIKSAELFPAVAQDLAQRNQWDKLMALLEKGKSLPVSEAQAAGWRALAAKNLSPADSSKAQNHLWEAISKGEANTDSPALLGAAVLAEDWGMPDLALKAYLKLAYQGSSRQIEMLEHCWQMATLLKDADMLMEIAGRMTKLRPDNQVLLQRQDYLRVLCGKEIEMTQLIKAPRSEGGDNVRKLIVHALRAYRMQDPATTKAFLKVIAEQDISELAPGERAVYAGLLAKISGDTITAFKVAEKISLPLLLAEESQFLTMAL